MIPIPLGLTNSLILLLRLRRRLVLCDCTRIRHRLRLGIRIHLGLIIRFRLVIRLGLVFLLGWVFCVNVRFVRCFGFGFVVCCCFEDFVRVGFVVEFCFCFADGFFVVVVFLPVAGHGESGSMDTCQCLKNAIQYIDHGSGFDVEKRVESDVRRKQESDESLREEHDDGRDWIRSECLEAIVKADNLQTPRASSKLYTIPLPSRHGSTGHSTVPSPASQPFYTVVMASPSTCCQLGRVFCIPRLIPRHAKLWLQILFSKRTGEAPKHRVHWREACRGQIQVIVAGIEPKQ